MQDTPTIAFRRLRPDQDNDLPLPRYMTPQAAGMDISAAVDAPLTLAPGKIALIPTGFAMALPSGYEAQIRPRSGLAVKHGIGIVNAPGTIDSDYRGELKVLMVNLGSEPVTIGRGDRIAQLLVAPVTRASFVETEDLTASERGEGGFGSTGV